MSDCSLSTAQEPHPTATTDPWRPLIDRIAAGEQTALNSLRVACLSRVYTVAKRILGNNEDAEEVVFDVLLWVWQHPQRHDPARGTVATWLNQLTWSRSIDRLRKRQRRDAPLHPESLLDSYEGQSELPEVWLAEFDQRSRVFQALRRLSAAQQQALKLAFFEGMSHQEIADATKRPLGTIKSHIRRALLQLGGLLQEYE